jgi:hypothetical protein
MTFSPGPMIREWRGRKSDDRSFAKLGPEAHATHVAQTRGKHPVCPRRTRSEPLCYALIALDLAQPAHGHQLDRNCALTPILLATAQWLWPNTGTP